MKRAFTLIIALLLSLLPACAFAATEVVDYTADFYVADYANVLSDEVEGLIVLNNDQLDKACGSQIVVVTIDTIESTTIENYAYTLFNKWGIGDKKKNNGLLILIAIEDGEYWLMPGKGLQDYLTAGDLDEMAYEHLIPQASQGNYEEGIRQLFAACFSHISISYDAGVSLDDTLYYKWLQTGSTSSGGSRFLTEPLREMPVYADPEPAVEATREPEREPARNDRGGFSFGTLIIILIVLIVIVGLFGRMGKVRNNRPGRAPAPRRPVAPPPPRPPMGGMGGPGFPM